MYVSTYLDKNKNILKVSERINGQRVTTDYPLILEYYIEDENGYYEGTNGKKLKKLTYSSAMQTNSLLKQYKESGIKTYELGFNLTNKVLYKYYKDSKAPDLHKSFFDIEVDRNGFEYLTVKELVDKACCPINAISIYNSWQEALFTLMLCPENIPFEEAQKICSKFENTVLFKDEKDLLNGIMLILSDSDALCGWNSCIPLDSSIWLPTKIIQMKDVKDGMELVDSTIKKVSNVNIKDKYEIKLFNGRTLYSSKEHVFPVYEYDKEKYFNINKNRTPILQKDMSVEDIINGMDKNSYFVKIKKHNNTNRDFTYRDFVLTYLDNLIEKYDFVFVDSKEIKIDNTKSSKTQKCYSKNKDYYTKDRIIDYINDNKHLSLKNYNHTLSFDIDLDEVISDEYFHILGLLYTDGTFEKKRNTIIFYNSNKPIIDKVGNIFEELYSVKREKSNPEYNVKGVYRRRITRNSKLGLLLEFIYNDNNDKKIDLYSLSKISKSQFMSFMSGCIDGDGWVSQNKIGFCNYNDDIKSISELLLWNGYMTSELNNALLFSSYDNSKLINDLDLWVDYKNELLHNSLFTPTKKESTAKSKLTKYRDDDVFWYVQIRDITLVEKNVEMIDICTSTSYFYTHGVKTHNCYFDIPYIIRRVENVLGKGESKRINLWDIEPYKKEKTNQFGDKNITYELYGKISVDYLELYKKHERGKKDSYKLDNIAEIELGEKKVQHDESLDDMYRQRYEDFIKYNRQDTLLVKKLDDKLKYINIHNRQCHSICCTYEATMGTVAWVDQAIINSCHENNQYVQDKDETKSQEFQQYIAPGAYVPTPITGLHKDIMSFDMASLYPNTCIALNMSSESIVGQVRLTLTKPYLFQKIEENELYSKKMDKTPDWGAAWGDEWGVLEYREIMNQTDTPLILDIEGGGSIQKTAKELHDLIFADGSNLCISGFGTIFRTDKDGRVSSVFKQWYAERKQFKKKMAHFEDLESGVKIESKELLNNLLKVLGPCSFSDKK